MIEEILNEDGTVYNPHENPLEEKWSKLYPPKPIAKYSQVCDGYSCMWCGICPLGDNWKCPEEDKEAYEKYFELWGGEDYYKLNSQTDTYEYIEDEGEM